ncbi:SIR2 family protein [Phocaeicola coprocola]|uniref:SIR2 family protein n=1 Tax=Phocaeicola coprocola TaxID=310298 RepID=UPI001C38B37B|nr:SIR2 family protein [Phocaeicola coprocola]MBV3867459.1 SIR2 family protein [Phocaeicola coprocola]MBV4008572.1 SIR2 family protein [Phocaeicola coprocola]MBV4033116.1 SIR2 family protein [Phocaeicola coprocola]MBV4039672.1 SIR2 family protein [Phocaeicola coprocola]MBV4061298.1 SIR2 family protein [Phocaeicola coprocola]
MKLDNSLKSHIQQLQDAARQNRLVIFVGAGVSASAGVPAWRELVDMFKNELPEGMYDQNDILKSAQIYRELRGEVEYMKQVKRILKYGQSSCNQIHKAIMELNPCHIVTTNYDDLLEQSALQNNKQYYVVVKDSDLPANQGERMLVKMHGDFREGNIVLTENDYFDYSRNFPLIRSFLLSLFSTKVILFIGFSFDDINLKYILREVSSILESKKQRVYMLVDDEKPALAYLYFLKKGIQLVSIPSSLSRSVLQSQKIDCNVTGLSHEKSIALYQNLRLIKNFNPSENDIISSAVDFFKKHDNQIRFWGKYLKYVFPSKYRAGFSISQSNLCLPYYYNDWFKENVIDNTEVLKKKYVANIDFLLNKLQINRIMYVDGMSIFEKKRADIYEKEREKGTLNIIYSLAVSDIVDRVKELRKRPHNYTIDDLELPYILFKIGRYKESYDIYKKLSSEFWKRRKYIVYFISLYNIKALSGKLLDKEYKNRDIDLSSLIKEIDEINLHDILKELPLESSVKELMEKLVNGNMLMEDWIESAKLNDELYQQRENAEKGGSSINSNIIVLLDSFEQTFFFCNENYILNECFRYSQDTYKMMIKGILHSIMTPSDNEQVQTKLDKLVYRIIPLFIFMINPHELKKVLDLIVADRPIPAEDDFVKKLSFLIGNLVEDLKKNSEVDYIDSNIVSNYIKNIILLLNRIEKAPNIENIYQIIIHYWYNGMFIRFGSELNLLYTRQKPTPDEAIKILDCALHSSFIHQGYEIENYIANLSYEANKEGRYLEDIVDVKQLENIKDLGLKAAFLLALSDSVRKELIVQIQSEVDNLYDLCIIELRSNLQIINGELINKLKEKVKKENGKFLRTEEIACKILYELSLKDEYEDIKEATVELSKVNNCYRFISDPLNYNDFSNIKDTWLEYLSDNDLKKLIENEKIRQMAFKYSEECLWDTEFRDRLWQLLK